MVENKKYANEKYSLDLYEVLDFMDTTLAKELPVAIFDIDYFTLAILNHKKSLIYNRMDDNMTSTTLNEIHDGYYHLISNRALNAIKPNREIKMDSYLTEALILADIEREKTEYPKITTEHVVLAILNPSFNLPENRLKKIFDKMGFTYGILLEKVNDDKPNLDKMIVDNMKDFFNQNNMKTRMILPESQFIVKMGPEMEKEIEKTQNMMKEMMGMSSSPVEQSKKRRKSTNNGNTNYPCISQYCVDITELAKKDKIEKLVGRNNEINTIIRTLGRRKKNNVIILGPEGSGKTAIAEGLAHRINDGEVPSFLKEKKLVSLDMTALIAGTTLRGMFEERVKQLLDEIKESGKHILIIDNIGEILSDKGKNDYDIAAMISHALDNGDIQVIGTADFKSYRNTFDKNPSLGRKFSKLIIDAPTADDAMIILNGNKTYYETFHNVKYDNDAIESCVLLAEKYITDRNLPDSAIDVMDEAGSFISTSNAIDENEETIEIQNQLNELRTKIKNVKKQDDYKLADDLNNQEKELSLKLIEKRKEVKKKNMENPIQITKDDIYNIVSSKTGIPINKLSVNDKHKIATMNERLKEEVIGQDEAIDIICKSIKRNRIGLQTSKCVFSGMMIGQTGTGKTLIAKKLAKELFGSEKALVRFDMSEFNDKTSVNKLIGSNPGYVGYDEGGQLTEVIKNKKYCVILLDEIEKADPEIYNIFLQVLDEGFLTDNTGQKIDFKNTIILFTSNVGTKMASDFGKGIGFGDTDNHKKVLTKELKKKFPPEFINRLDNVIYFNSLNENNLKDIIKLELNKVIKKLNNLGYNMNYHDDVVNYLYKTIQDDKEYGARPIIRTIQDEIENKITDLMIENDYEKDYIFNVKCIYNNSLPYVKNISVPNTVIPVVKVDTEIIGIEID